MKRILVVSHNAFGSTSNMGKTLMSYFNKWDAECIAQLYIRPETPSENMCHRYFRVTDFDMLRSVFTRRSGTVFGVDDIKEKSKQKAKEGRIKRAIYAYARKRTPLVYASRNMLWQLGAFNTRALREWICDFAPEAVFLASGDYSFTYRIALGIAKSRGIPLYISCVDDFYIYNKNENSLLGRAVHRSFLRQVKKSMNYASAVFAICQRMSDDYSKLFGISCHTLYTAASFVPPLEKKTMTNRITYIGNLGHGRDRQLVDMGRALLILKCENKPKYIDVYSAEKDPKVLSGLTEKNGINFGGEIDSDEARRVMSKSMLLIHTESFAERDKQRCMYSVSTKTADLLGSGACILAYGPCEVASMKYLSENEAAVCITSKEELEQGLARAIEDSAVRVKITSKALKLALENHSQEKAAALIASVINGCESEVRECLK